MKIQFDKFQGCGNDFIIINNLSNNIILSTEQIKKLCDRHFGIGADGLILLETKDGFYYMNYYNADGSPAEMCGNGLRCTVAFIKKNFPLETKSFQILCPDGFHWVKILDDTIQVSVSPPNFQDDIKNVEYYIQKLSEKTLKNINSYGLLSVGNPHLVIHTNNIDNFALEELKLLSENSVKGGVNVNLVKVVNSEEIQVKTYERGDGITLACGTGACASASYMNKLGLCKDKLKINIPGGSLEVNLVNNELVLTGPAQHIFEGEVELFEKHDRFRESRN